MQTYRKLTMHVLHPKLTRIEFEDLVIKLDAEHVQIKEKEKDLHKSKIFTFSGYPENTYTNRKEKTLHTITIISNEEVILEKWKNIIQEKAV